MGGVGPKLAPVLVLVRHLLDPPNLSGPIAGVSWTHSHSKQS